MQIPIDTNLYRKQIRELSSLNRPSFELWNCNTCCVQFKHEIRVHISTLISGAHCAIYFYSPNFYHYYSYQYVYGPHSKTFATWANCTHSQLTNLDNYIHTYVYYTYWYDVSIVFYNICEKFQPKDFSVLHWLRFLC